jgi:hypothetical protein
MEKCAHQTEAVRARLVKQFEGNLFDEKLRDLFEAATSDSKRDVRLRDLENPTRSKEVALRRGLAARSMAKAYKRWRARMKPRRAKEM